MPSTPTKMRKANPWIKNIRDHWELYLIMLVPLIFLFVFAYYPMYGAQIAFKDFKVRAGIWGSPWVGVKHFQAFFNAYDFWRLIENTLTISIVSLIIGFPMPIILAISLNECRSDKFKKVVQMSTYAPYFISTVVLVSMMNIILAQNGIINTALAAIGLPTVSFMGTPELFKYVYSISGVWQGAGYSAVIYIAALSGVDPQLHEAAIIDGANKFQRICHIDIPSILPTAVILLILNMGSILNVGFEKTFLMQNPLNISKSDVISTYVYRLGLINAQYSFSTAVGLFNSIVGLTLTILANEIARRLGDTSLW